MTPPYAVRLSHSASAYLRRLSPAARARIVAQLTEVAAAPFDPRHAKQLQGGTGDRSARVGALRIIFTVEIELREIQVSRIGPRGQIYRDR